jgi:hypothetical protein
VAVATLHPNGDGTLTSWTDEGGGAPFFDSIDDYRGGGAHDSDTTFIAGPNVADGSAFIMLDDSDNSFYPPGITLVQCVIAYRMESAGVSSGADTIALSVGLVQNDETSLLTDLVSVSTNVGTTYTESTVTLTNPVTSANKTVWDGGKLRIFQDYTLVGCADTTARLRVSAARVEITYTPNATPPGPAAWRSRYGMVWPKRKQPI